MSEDEEVTSLFSFCQTVLTFRVSETQFKRVCRVVNNDPFLDRHAKYQSEFTLLLEDNECAIVFFNEQTDRRIKIKYYHFTIDLENVDDLVLKTLLASWLGIECEAVLCLPKGVKV